ncbi:hypothetical protein QUF84_25080 [Fictibacillus enclensis]|uniref:hypothetical protein n=1 Tax=Fictibacillus enclensis TaxID=1017270 RepID=UPI0025A09B03|nr:hypothetical protein [Fictibacillus enclensis]MDM5340472.1 hypothetical protein [Fictibacillus enclensis]
MSSFSRKAQIWQTVNHLNYYNALLVRQVNDTTPRKKASNNKATFGDIGEPPNLKWQAILAEIRLICENLCKTLPQVNDSQLNEELVGGLARQILHNLWQIVLIRKQQGSWPKGARIICMYVIVRNSKGKRKILPT